MNAENTETQQYLLAKDRLENNIGKVPLLVRPQPITSHPQCRNPYPLVNRGGSRLVYSTGKYNVSKNRTREFWMAHIRDFSHTLVESSWKWIILAFISSYILCWLIFAWFYQLVSISNGDHDGNYTSSNPCLIGINSFTGYYLFSLETQHSIGFGSRFPTDNCVEGVFILSMQVILGSAICGGMATLVYTKMVKPESPKAKKLFAKNAVICQRNGQLCLIFRVRDLEKRYQIGTKITAFMIEKRKDTPFIRSLELDTPGLLIWPMELSHRITSSSPLWNLSAKDLLTMRLEFVLTLEGTSVLTGQASTTTTSYVSSEILWGHRFRPCIRYDNDLCTYVVNQDYFHETEEVLTALCSGNHLQQIFDYYYNSYCNSAFDKIKKTKKASNGSSSSEHSSNASLDSSVLKNDEIEKKQNFIKEVARKLSVISETKSREAAESDDKNVTEDCSDEILKLEEDVDRCLNDLKRELSDIGQLQTEKAVYDVEKLVLELQKYN